MGNISRIIPGANQDNTGARYNVDFQTPAFAAVLNVVTSADETTVQQINLTGAQTINVAVGVNGSGTPGTPGYIAPTPPYPGQQLVLVFGSVAGATVTFGTGFSVSAPTLVIAAGKKGALTAQFDGLTFVETGRSVTV